MAFCDLDGNVALAEAFLREVLARVLADAAEDMRFFDERIEKGVVATLEHVVASPFERVSYTEAVAILEKSGRAFEFPVRWGADLQSEHERYLTEEKIRRPVVVTDYPRAIKEANLDANRRRHGFRFTETTIQHADLPALLDGVTHVFHLAAQAGVRKSWGKDFTTYTTNNVEATQILLEACVGRPIERFVHASSSSVYGDRAAIPMREDALPQPVSPYGVTKLAAEQLCVLYCQNFKVPTISLRYFTVYGPRQRPDMGFHKFLLASRRGEPIPVYGDGEQTRDFTYVDDAVEANLLAAVRGMPGGVYNIGGGARVTVNEVLAMIGRVSGRVPARQTHPAQKGDMRHTFADTARAKADLGFSPKVGLEEGLSAEYQWIASIE
jgi:UDP-glucose 4-epimerase